MTINKCPTNLRQLLADLLRHVGNPRFLWCTENTGFETCLKRRDALLLGGACAPGSPAEPGGQCTLAIARVLRVSPGESEPSRDLIPLLESVTKNAESLLVVVDDEDKG